MKTKDPFESLSDAQLTQTTAGAGGGFMGFLQKMWPMIQKAIPMITNLIGSVGKGGKGPMVAQGGPPQGGPPQGGPPQGGQPPPDATV